ncbi:MAG: GNAT family N-acetyltransferase [Myxococcota bacterium]
MDTRLLTPADVPAVEAFLADRADTSMFLRSNLRAAGIVDRGQRYQGAWVGAFAEGLSGVACHGWNGMLLLQAPLGALPALVDAAVAASGRAVAGFTGPTDQVRAAREHLGWTARTAALDSDEDLFALDLGALVAGPGAVRRAGAADVAALVPWRFAYEQETLGRAAAPEAVADSLAASAADGALFVAEADGALVAMSAFNARLPDTVQIGGVYTPPALRGRGHGRAVVGGSLRLAAAEGVQRAILFTDRDNAPAQRAYRALGFHVVGSYGLVLF